MELNRDNFESLVLESDQTVLIDFWSPQCGPCLAMNPFVERIEGEFGSFPDPFCSHSAPTMGHFRNRTSLLASRKGFDCS
jgi:thiol-disulfide isomerase/thioredoxin